MNLLAFQQEEKEYNNEELESRICESFLQYPIKKVPFKDRPGVLLSKMIGRVKRMFLNKNAELLLEENFSNDSKHTRFVNEIADLKGYRNHIAMEQEDDTKEIGKEDDIESSR